MSAFIAILRRNAVRLLLTFFVVALVTWLLVRRMDNSLYDPYCSEEQWLYCAQPSAPQ